MLTILLTSLLLSNTFPLPGNSFIVSPSNVQLPKSTIFSPEAMIDPQFNAELQKIHDDRIPTITVKELTESRNDSVCILDTREENEFQISHLRHARNVGYFWFDMRDIYDIPKDRKIVVYCAVGNRSQRIAELLIRAGYKNVSTLYGGIFEWVNEGYPVYTLQDAQTSQIHAYNKRWSMWLKRGTKVF